MKAFNPIVIDQLKADLAELDEHEIEIDGIKLRPSECYHFDVSPRHVLFNTNCPEALRNKVEAIIEKHFPATATGE